MTLVVDPTVAEESGCNNRTAVYIASCCLNCTALSVPEHCVPKHIKSYHQIMPIIALEASLTFSKPAEAIGVKRITQQPVTSKHRAWSENKNELSRSKSFLATRAPSADTETHSKP